MREGQGFPQRHPLTVTRYDEPKSIELQGRGRGGIRLNVEMTVSANDPGSTFHLTADLKGGLLSGPIGAWSPGCCGRTCKVREQPRVVAVGAYRPG